MLSPDVMRFSTKLFLFILPLLVVFEMSMGGWLKSEKMNQLALIRNEDVYYDVGGLYPSSHKIHYRRDRFGFRGTYSDLSQIDILSIGPSTVDQRYISEDETWQDQLALAFRENGQTISVLNGGVDGFSVSYFEPFLQEWFFNLPGFHTKYILLVLSSAEAQTHGPREIKKSEPTWIENFRQNSALQFYVFGLFGTLQSKYFANHGGHSRVDFAQVPWTNKGHIENYGAYSRAKLDAFRIRMHSLVMAVRAHGAEPVFVTSTRHNHVIKNGEIWGIETAEDHNGVDDYHLNKMFTAYAMNLCHAENSICIDAANAIEFDDRDFYDMEHNTPSGARKIGRYLFTQLNGLNGLHGLSTSAQ